MDKEKLLHILAVGASLLLKATIWTAKSSWRIVRRVYRHLDALCILWERERRKAWEGDWASWAMTTDFYGEESRRSQQMTNDITRSYYD